ncbi:MAG: Type cbb3 cytochrome oxidase biosis protein CcoG, involved in Cu oxidation, partial [Myxococcaceae bacterium]|nr:Type cbb3 cytochrome oxidase biosis protein CcoG, involved in Cu oxidation [Myxococcaceae bacterium]
TVFLLTGAAVGLVVVTAVVGRVWCGWACPQTVFLEGVFRRIERAVEGPREKRMRRAHGPWTIDRVWRKVVVHAAYLLASLALAHVLLSYFVSLEGMFAMVVRKPGDHPEAFLVVSITTGILYFNFAWFREQLCVVMCPYGRLQSALLDDDSLVVGYDVARGEPRGKVADESAGDCVACERCVVVCPTGIDIRNGLQMDCIACTACIDACDEIMDKVGRPRGLIRYDSPHGLAGEPRRVLRPRLYLYAALVGAGVLAASFAFAGHVPFEANVIRGGGEPYTVTSDSIRNGFAIHLVNKLGHDATFLVAPIADAAHPVELVIPLARIRLPSLGSAEAPVFVTMPKSSFDQEFTVRLRVSVEGSKAERVVEAPFLGPHGGAR